MDYEPKNEEYIQDMKENATYSEIKERIKEKYGFEKRPNYNIGDKKSREPNYPVEKEKVIVEVFKYFRMI